MLTKRETTKIQKTIPSSPNMLLTAFRALGDPTRYRIFSLLATKGGLCVTEVAHIFSVSVPAASHQLKVLENSGLVVGERHGQTMCYELRKDSLKVRVIAKLVLH